MKRGTWIFTETCLNMKYSKVTAISMNYLFYIFVAGGFVLQKEQKNTHIVGICTILDLLVARLQN